MEAGGSHPIAWEKEDVREEPPRKHLSPDGTGAIPGFASQKREKHPSEVQQVKRICRAMESNCNGTSPGPMGVDSGAGKLPTVSTPDDPRGPKQVLPATLAPRHDDPATPPKKAPADALVPLPCWLRPSQRRADGHHTATGIVLTKEMKALYHEAPLHCHAVTPQLTQRDEEDDPREILLLPQEAIRDRQHQEKVVLVAMLCATHENDRTVISHVRLKSYISQDNITAGRIATQVNAWNENTAVIYTTGIVGEVKLPRDELDIREVIVVQEHGQWRSPKCPCQLVSHGESNLPPVIRNIPRLEALLAQGPWVAVDEMTWYLENLVGKHLEVCRPADHATDLEAWIAEQWNSATEEVVLASAVLTNHHWEPWMLRVDGEVAVLITGPAAAARLHYTDAFHMLDKEDRIDVQTIRLDTTFHADCGFQTIAWLTDQDRVQGHRACTTSIATHWRRQFTQSLIEKETDQCIVSHIELGGARSTGEPADPLAAELAKLLHIHGVPTEESQARAQSVLHQMGRQPVQTALRSARPWAELKSRSNASVPRIQLVLPSELQEVIRQRNRKGIGNRSQKQKPRHTPAVLSPPDVSIPTGVFKQVPDIPLAQLQFDNIGQGRQGVVIVTAQQALAYLKITTPITKEGLALLILDHDHPSFAGVGECIRFQRNAWPVTSPS